MAEPLPSHLSDCTKEQLSPLILRKSPKLSEAAVAILFEQEIDGETFIRLTDDLLKEMNLTIGSRLKILNLIEEGPFFFFFSSFQLESFFSS